jgi:hypothetical protein
MNDAFNEKQRAYNAQDNAWQEVQAVRNRNSPQIDECSRNQQTAYENMGRAYDDASAAHGRRDGAAARSYADRGREYKAESQRYVARRRELIAEIRAAGDRHKATQPAFQAAKVKFATAKAEFDRLKAIHETARTKFQEAKAAHESAKTAFTKRLEIVRAANQRRNEDKKALAIKAGVPLQYQDKVYVTTKPDGTVHLYFGGLSTPDGLGHGHYVMDKNGKVTYKRDPFDPHGKQNFQHDAALERRLGSIGIAMAARERRATGPQTNQYHDGDVTVKVRSGFDARTNSVATDVIVIDRVNSPDEHLHLILSEHDGSILFSEWRRITNVKNVQPYLFV